MELFTPTILESFEKMCRVITTILVYSTSIRNTWNRRTVRRKTEGTSTPFVQSGFVEQW